MERGAAQAAREDSAGTPKKNCKEARQKNSARDACENEKLWHVAVCSPRRQ